VIAGYRSGIAALRKAIPGVRIVGATITPAGGNSGNAGAEAVNQRRKAINDTLRVGGLFDAVLDFERAVRDPGADALRPVYVPNSTIGGPGDHLHPNRAGYLAIAGSIDLSLVVPGLGGR
jgi:hypothetical protein